jgi:hypothetical protein
MAKNKKKIVKIARQTTVTCAPEVKQFIKIAATFMGVSQSKALRLILMHNRLMPPDGSFNMLSNWDDETRNSYDRFVKDQLAKDYIRKNIDDF